MSPDDARAKMEERRNDNDVRPRSAIGNTPPPTAFMNGLPAPPPAAVRKPDFPVPVGRNSGAYISGSGAASVIGGARSPRRAREPFVG
jgi:hypothetical protein